MKELENITLQELEAEVSRRRQQAVDHQVISLSDEEIANQINAKKLNEIQELHDQMFPGVSGEYDEFYPTWKESRLEKVRDALKNRGKNLTLGEAMYPSMNGAK